MPWERRQNYAVKTRLLALVVCVVESAAQQAPVAPEVLLVPDTLPPLAKSDYPVFTRAYDIERAREWDKARALYQHVLAQQPNHPQARDGLTRASMVRVAELHLDMWVAEAQRLAAMDSFQPAIRAFNSAMKVKPDYLNNDSFRELHAILMAQNAPVEITLQSDGQTWVMLENYRAPSKLDRQTIKILPGNYRVVGRRNGYQNSEQILRVRAGAPQVVTVTCTVPLPNPADDPFEEQRVEREYQEELRAHRRDEAAASAQFEQALETIRKKYLPESP
jgi:tetratricopeptide (TPR) repeat protein